MTLAQCVTDGRMIICDHDAGFSEILQQSSSELLGASIYDLTHPEDLSVNRQLLDGLRNEGTRFSITKRYIRGNGDVLWVTNHVSHLSGVGYSAKILATVQVINKPRLETSSKMTMLAEQILDVRKSRLRIFGDGLFGEPDYEIILDLFVNEQRGRLVSVSSSCIAASVPPTTALRHIARLVALGWIERVGDPLDKRRTNLALTSRGFTGVTRYLDECYRRSRLC